ncbi:MAG: elongation factor Ts [Candidatus Kerfeldbacteria bacterium]|nr:elongation factor Ts [Candidatus Kerfeldbacteria bacterium]
MYTAQDVQKLRQVTGAGIMAAKKALEEAKGDLTAAVDILRKQGGKIAASKMGRATGQGLVESYIHAGGKIGALVELACETDFVARTEQFKNLAHDLAMQVAAANPLYLSPAEVPVEIVEHEKQIYLEQLASAGKTGPMVDKIIEGKLQKHYAEVCLMRQPFFKDDQKTVADVLTEAMATIGENIKIKHFARFELSGKPSVCSVKD